MAFFGGFAPTMLVAKNLVATNVEVAKKKASNDDDDDPLRSSTSAKNSSTTNSNNSPPTSAAPSSSSLMPPQHHQQQQHHQHHMGAPSPVGRRPGASPIPPPVYHQSGSQQGYTSAPQTSAVISSSATAAMDSMSGNGAYRSMHLQHIPPPQQQHIQHHQYHPMQQQQQQQPHIRHGPPPSPLPPQHFQQQHQQQIGMPPVNGQSAGGDDIRLLLERQNQLVEMQRLQLEHQNRIIAEQQRMMDMERQQILIQQQQQQQQQQSLPMSRTGSAYSRRASNYNSVDSGLGPELVHQGNPVEADQVYRSEILGKQHAGISNSTGRASSHYSVDTLTSPVSSTANAENNPLSTSAVSTSTNATAVATANGKKPSGLAVTLDDLLLALGDTINELQDVKTPTSPGGSVMKTPASPTGANVSKGLEMARSPSFGGGLGAEIEGGLGEEMVQFTVGSLLQTSA
ncbi:hypothetical protein BC829DRAFT_322 [Chytridium lagenaria]|nr:hypothetical protein BC829DRAFT_322 [Chytridium lagenaria]